MVRVLCLSEYNLRYEAGTFYGKACNFFNTIARYADIAGHIVAPSFPHQGMLHYAFQFHPDKSRWRTAALMNPAVFKLRSEAIEKALQAYEGQYDTIVQLHTLQAPGIHFKKRPYVIITDNNYRLSLRHWPDWTPARGYRVHEQWIALEKEVYENACALLVYSDFTRQSMLDDYGISPEKVHAIGVGAHLMENSPSDKDYTSKIALFVGYDFERKGGYELLAAWDIVRQYIPDATLQIAGVRKPVKMIDGVEWQGRIRDRSKMKALYQNATLFVMPSRFEPWGLAFFEAMGMGLPCIGLNAGATPEVIAHQQTGLLVEPGNIQLLADALITMLKNPVATARMGQDAYKRVTTQFSWDAVAQRMMPHIETCGT